MSKQTITINIDVRDGYELKYNSETRTVEEVIKEPIRSKSWEEFCKNHPQISYEYFLQQSQTMVIPPTTETRMNFRHTSHGEQSKCLLETKEDAEGIIALIQLTRLHDEWVGDWKIYNNGAYYSITHDRVNLENFVIEYCNLRLLSFPTKEMAEEFLDCFKDLIKRAKRFI